MYRDNFRKRTGINLLGWSKEVLIHDDSTTKLMMMPAGVYASPFWNEVKTVKESLLPVADFMSCFLPSPPQAGWKTPIQCDSWALREPLTMAPSATHHSLLGRAPHPYPWPRFLLVCGVPGVCDPHFRFPSRYFRPHFLKPYMPKVLVCLTSPLRVHWLMIWALGFHKLQGRALLSLCPLDNCPSGDLA